jgi:poly-beta-1,6-N-acetyl-D-glucosamine biosynthesis protein PgaD
VGDPLIETPDAQSAVQRALLTALTGVFWAIWTYLWLPVVSLVEWLFDASWGYQDFVLEGYEALAEVAIAYGAVIFVMGGSLVGWGLYNMIRFRGVERRRPAPALDQPALARYYKVDAGELSCWRAARRLVIRYHANDTLSTVQFDKA